MNIVHVITRLIVGGAQENTLLSCQGQHDAGHHVTLLTGPTAGPEGSLLSRARADGYRVEIVDDLVRALDPARDVRATRTLRRRFDALRPDVIHTHSSKAGIIGRWAAIDARRRGTLVVHTIHGLAFTAGSSRLVNAGYRWAEKVTAAKTDVIVSVADAMTRQSLAGGVGHANQYVTVRSGMDVRPFLRPDPPRDVMRRRLGFDDTHVVVATIARLFDLKGHDDLLDLAPTLCARHPALRFLWVGDGSRRDAFERRIDTLGLRGRFVLAGLVPPEAVPAYVGAADVVAHPSRREGLARAIVQGSLGGCPTVAYDIDGNAEAIVQGETGYAVRAFDVRAFGERLGELAGDADSRRRLGTAGRAFAAQRFDTGVMVAALERVYEDGVRRRRGTT